MAKAFVGVRLQRLREERRLSQVALARALGISASYLNQIERNQRPLTVPISLRLGEVLGVDTQLFADGDDKGLIADLRAVFGDLSGEASVSVAEVKALAANMPAAARAIVDLHRRHRAAAERADLLAAQLGDDSRTPRWKAASNEEVRDYLNRRQNHVAELDEPAERIFEEEGLSPGNTEEGLRERLRRRHGLRCQVTTALDGVVQQRRYDVEQRTLWLADALRPGQRAFQMAAQLALLELGETIDALIESGGFSGPEARAPARVGLSNYFAGALLMPYRLFLQAAEEAAYDIEQLAHRFGTGFEAVCHRLSTMQRPGAPGLPLFFIRVDRAGNVSKRQSATDFHFSRVGGTCPLWIVYEAFNHPGEVLTQVAQMPDGRTYFWIAHQVVSGPSSYGARRKTFAIGLGCDIRNAPRMIYSKGLALHDPSAATPIGAGCKVCERPACPQRAVPAVTLTR